jgi:hypothetical protein
VALLLVPLFQVGTQHFFCQRERKAPARGPIFLRDLARLPRRLLTRRWRKSLISDSHSADTVFMSTTIHMLHIAEDLF